ncbi:MAG: shikimate dehydrogenase [Crocosphaera sp.]
MSESPITVTYSLEEILKKIDGNLDKLDTKLDNIEQKFDNKLDNLEKKFDAKFDKIEVRLTNLEVGQTKLNTEVQNLKETDILNLREDIKDIKTTQNSLVQEIADLKGVKSLIIPIVVAVATALLTLLFRILPNSFG